MLGAKFAPEWSLTEEVEPQILLASARAEAERDVYFVPSRSAVPVGPLLDTEARVCTTLNTPLGNELKDCIGCLSLPPYIPSINTKGHIPHGSRPRL